MKSVQSVRETALRPTRPQGVAFVWVLAIIGLVNATFAILVAAHDYLDHTDAGRESTSGELWLGALIGSGLLSSLVLIWLSVERLRSIRADSDPMQTSGNPALSIHSQAVLRSLASPLLLHPPEASDGCAVMLVGMDDFEHLLKAHGRRTTETALRAMGNALTRSVRASDVVARVGYDGFAIVLAVGDKDVVLRAAGRIRDAILRTTIPLPNNGTLTLSGSIGVATCPGDDAVESAFERAHAALEQAITEGHGEVRLAGDSAGAQPASAPVAS